MPTVSRDYNRVVFKAELIQGALALIETLQQEADKGHEEPKRYDFQSNSLRRKNENWRFDSFDEFFAEYRKGFDRSTLTRQTNDFQINFEASMRSDYIYTTVEVRAPLRSILERIFDDFEKAVESSRVPVVETEKQSPTIFIGHGRNAQWRDLKDHLHELHKHDVQAYEIGARAGHTIRDILDEMLSKSSFAILVMTAEDETPEGTFRPRMNVVHELGLFQGKLGFARAVVLLEEGTEEFSNIHGIHQIRFSKGRIRETFGDILATLRREFSTEKLNRPG